MSRWRSLGKIFQAEGMAREGCGWEMECIWESEGLVWLDLGLGFLEGRGGDGRWGQRGKQEPGPDGFVNQIGFGQDLGNVLRMEVSRGDERQVYWESGRLGMRSRAQVERLFWGMF